MTAQLPHQTHHSGSHRDRAGPRAPPPQRQEGQQQRMLPAEADSQRPSHTNNPLVDQRANSGGEGYATTLRFHPYPSPKGGGGLPGGTTTKANADTAATAEGPMSTPTATSHSTLHPKGRGKPLAPPPHSHPHQQHPGSGARSSKQQQQRGAHVGGEQPHGIAGGVMDSRPPPRVEEERPFRSPKLYPSFHDDEGHLWYRNNPYGENPTVAMDSEGNGVDGGFLLSSTAAARAAGAKRGGEAFTTGRRGGRESSKPINYCRHHLLGKCNRGAMCRFAHLKQHDVVLKVTRTPQGLRAAPQSIDILGDCTERDDDLSGFALPPSTAPVLFDGVGASGNASATSSPATTGSSKVMPAHARAPATQPYFPGNSSTAGAPQGHHNSSGSAYRYLDRSGADIVSSSSPPLSAVLSPPHNTGSSVHVHAPYATPVHSTASRVRSNDPYVSPGGVLGEHDDPLVLFEHAFADGCDDGGGGGGGDEAAYTDSGSVSPPLHGVSTEEMTADEAGEFDTFHATAAAAHPYQRYPTYPSSGYRDAPSSTFSAPGVASSGGYATGPHDGSVGSSPRMQRTETLEFVDTVTTTVHVASGGSVYDDTRENLGNVDEAAFGGAAGDYTATAVAVVPAPPAASSSHSGSLPASYHSSPSLGFQPSPPLVASWPSAVAGGGGDELLDFDNFSLPRPSAGAFHPRQQSTTVHYPTHRTPSTSPAPPQQQLTPQWFAASFPGAMTVANQPYSMLLPPAVSGTSPCGWNGGQSSTNGPILPPYLTGSSCEVLTSSDPPSRYMTPQVTAEEEAILKSLW